MYERLERDEPILPSSDDWGVFVLVFIRSDGLTRAFLGSESSGEQGDIEVDAHVKENQKEADTAAGVLHEEPQIPDVDAPLPEPADEPSKPQQVESAQNITSAVPEVASLLVPGMLLGI